MTEVQKETSTRRFVPRKDGWLVFTLLAIPVLMLWAAGTLIFGQAPVVLKAVLAPIALCVAAFCVWVLFGTSYVVYGDALLVRLGPLRWRIRLAAIAEITLDRNLLSSAALSRERLRIRQKGGAGDIYISPLDRQGFLDALREAYPSLRVKA